MSDIHAGMRRDRRLATRGRRSLAVTAVAALVLTGSALPAQAGHAADEAAEAHASILELGAGATPLLGAARSSASSESNPGPNRANLDPTVLGAQTIRIAGVDVPLDELVTFGQAGAILSESTATSPYDTRAISGVVGSDGAVHLDSATGGYAPAEIDLLALLKRAKVDGLTKLVLEDATLLFGIGGAEVVTENGTFLDPDGVGGLGQYRVGQADLRLGSPLVKHAASQIYDAVGRMDTVTEDQVNQRLSTAQLGGAFPDGTTLSAAVDSQMQERIFRAILAQPVTTKNEVLTVDFSTGTATLHLDKALHGEEPQGGPLLTDPPVVRPGDPTGLNAQHPNTELIDDELYPMIAETVHDLMEEVTSIAIGAVEGALGSVTVTVTATNPDATATASYNLTATPVGSTSCTPTSADGAAACEALEQAFGTAPVDGTLGPIRDFLVGDGGRQVFEIAVDDIKTQAVTAQVRKLLDPVLQLVAGVVSVQVNHQRPSSCRMPDGSSGIDSLKVSAVSVAVLRATNVAVLNLGNAGSRVDACAPTARASLVETTWGSRSLAAAGDSRATAPGDPGPNGGGLNAHVLGNELIDLGDVEIPLDELVDFGDLGAMQSESTATSPYDARAVAGILGGDGSISADSTPDGFEPATIDLLALLRGSGTPGTGDLPIDELALKLAIGGAEVIAQDGTILDQDGVGGPGQYRVGRADLLLHSREIEKAAAQIYDAVGRLDQVAEDQVNRLLDLTAITAGLPTGTSVTAQVRSNMQDEIFAAILARPVTTKNEVLTVDFSTGTATLRLDRLLHGEETVDGPILDPQKVRPGDPTGLNAQHPNTELIDDELYPMIAETVHDLMNEVSRIALGSVEGALRSVTVRFTATTEPGGGNSATATWEVNLGGQRVQPVQCTYTGPLGGVLCLTLSTAAALVATVVDTAVVPVREFLVGNKGERLFRLAIDDVKTGMITIPVRAALEPTIELLAKVVSVQVNHQRTGTCTLADGSKKLASLRVSAVSVALLRGTGAGRLELGNAEVHTPCT